MPYSRRSLTTALLLPALVGLAHLAQAQTYTVQDLGTLDNTQPFNYSDAIGINGPVPPVSALSD